MILQDSTQNVATLSNTGGVTAFSIKATAKSFQILSAGLYSNKIKAIVRELSTNALDAHIAIGKAHIPFSVHLPTPLEPYFSVQDYGVGLTEEEVTNIFTTFFESTKTGSNDFVGALGLGSKSPFSYTSNFTITAVKNGIKNIFTAFINDSGVPNIAKMFSEQTEESSGVEIKFAVDSSSDFRNFANEACNVYKYFKVKPNLTGVDIAFKIPEIKYAIENVAPNVHVVEVTNRNSYHYNSSAYAIMGNIAYPIEFGQLKAGITSDDEVDYYEICNMPLEIHFEIGEIEFQPSREGLSYTKRTIDSLLARMRNVKQEIFNSVKAQSDAIDNVWEKAKFLNNMKEQVCMNAAASQCLKELPANVHTDYYSTDVRVFLSEMQNFNIQVSAYKTSSYVSGLTQVTQFVHRSYDGPEKSHYRFTVSDKVKFVVNDTKSGLGARVRYNSNSMLNGVKEVYILSKIDKTKDMDIDGLKAIIHNPPDHFMVGTDLNVKPSEKKEKVDFADHILQLERRGGYKGNSDDMVWRDSGTNFNDSTKTFYYVELNGSSFKSAYGVDESTSDWYDYIKSAAIMTFGDKIYGVRKSIINEVKSMKNWVNIEDHIVKNLRSLTDANLIGLVKSELDKMEWIKYNSSLIGKISDKNGTYYKTVDDLAAIQKSSGEYSSVRVLADWYLDPKIKKDKAMLEKIKAKFSDPRAEGNKIYNKYPLLRHISAHSVNINDVADYINLIDSKN
jgi:hypothetical protein